ncbi:glucokinase-like ROK family protein [Comamonas sp. BIGb0124]|uniref:ROK family protein n=1 Tax=Comamonas sp. BIGb0124 TaxID=2485130 RepID=UPI000FC20DCF|nr:glucokinase-like ROK family protein [Comamonas sp. BIGb0124]
MLTPWNDLSMAELTVLETAFWSSRTSRHALAGLLDYSKSKANATVAALIERGLLQEAGLQSSSGGRRPEGLRLSERLGVVAGVDLGATSVDVALMAPDLSIRAHHAEAIDVRAGPGVVLPRVRAVLRELLARLGLEARDVMGIGMGVPGPVAFDQGMLVAPPLMPLWDGFSIREDLRQDYTAPVFIDNDVNLMALAEQWRLRRQLPDFLVLKVGTGIGCGIICHGQVHRGATGSAGDVGHICVDQQGPMCHCGNRGCVEAMAAGPAIARLAEEAARQGDSALLAEWFERDGQLLPEQVAQASRAGDATASGIVQRAGGLIGQMLASLVNFFNPSHVFIGGGVTNVGPLFLAAVRQSVYQRSLALSTRHLEIQFSPLGGHTGVTGAGVLAMQETLRTRGVAP